MKTITDAKLMEHRQVIEAGIDPAALKAAATDLLAAYEWERSCAASLRGVVDALRRQLQMVVRMFGTSDGTAREITVPWEVEREAATAGEPRLYDYRNNARELVLRS